VCVYSEDRNCSGLKFAVKHFALISFRGWHGGGLQPHFLLLTHPETRALR
jgi:hypothetical protein